MLTGPVDVKDTVRVERVEGPSERPLDDVAGDDCECVAGAEDVWADEGGDAVLSKGLKKGSFNTSFGAADNFNLHISRIIEQECSERLYSEVVRAATHRRAVVHQHVVVVLARQIIRSVCVLSNLLSVQKEVKLHVCGCHFDIIRSDTINRESGPCHVTSTGIHGILQHIIVLTLKEESK